MSSLRSPRSELKVKRRRGISELWGSKGKAARNLKAVLAAEHYDQVSQSQPTYVNIEAPPSMKPEKKYCDISGLPAKYTDPKTKMRFSTAAAFQTARELPEHKVEEILGLRQAQTRIK